MAPKKTKKQIQTELEYSLKNQSDEVDKAYVPHEDHILEIHTLHGTIFKNLFDGLKTTLTEANLIFTKKGIKLTTADNDMNVLVHLFMFAESFDFYFCQDDEFIAGIDIELIHRTMKANKSNDLMCFIVHKDRKKDLDISFESFQKGTKVRDQISLRDLPQCKFVDSIDYPRNSPEMDASVFQTICREMSSFGATLLEIETSGNELIFRNINGDNRRTVRIQMDPNNDNSEKFSGGSQKGTFLLPYLKAFSKSANVSNRVKLFLKTDFPLTLEYSVGNHLGTLRYLLSPEDTDPE